MGRRRAVDPEPAGTVYRVHQIHGPVKIFGTEIHEIGGVSQLCYKCVFLIVDGTYRYIPVEGSEERFRDVSNSDEIAKVFEQLENPPADHPPFGPGEINRLERRLTELPILTLAEIVSLYSRLACRPDHALPRNARELRKHLLERLSAEIAASSGQQRNHFVVKSEIFSLVKKWLQ